MLNQLQGRGAANTQRALKAAHVPHGFFHHVVVAVELCNNNRALLNGAASCQSQQAGLFWKGAGLKETSFCQFDYKMYFLRSNWWLVAYKALPLRISRSEKLKNHVKFMGLIFLLSLVSMTELRL